MSDLDFEPSIGNCKKNFGSRLGKIFLEDGLEDLDDFDPYDEHNDLPIADDYSTDDSDYISW